MKSAKNAIPDVTKLKSIFITYFLYLKTAHPDAKEGVH